MLNIDPIFDVEIFAELGTGWKDGENKGQEAKIELIHMRVLLRQVTITIS